MRQIILFGLSLLLSACSTTNYYTQTVQSWRGGDSRSLIKQWGSPDDTLRGANGNTYYVYQTDSYGSYSGPSSPSVGVTMGSDGKPIMTTFPNTNTTGNRGLTLGCTVIFSVNSSGQVFETNIRGSACYGSQGFAKRLANPNVNVVSNVQNQQAKQGG